MSYDTKGVYHVLCRVGENMGKLVTLGLLYLYCM